MSRRSDFARLPATALLLALALAFPVGCSLVLYTAEILSQRRA